MVVPEFSAIEPAPPNCSFRTVGTAAGSLETVFLSVLIPAPQGALMHANVLRQSAAAEKMPQFAGRPSAKRGEHRVSMGNGLYRPGRV